MIGQWAARDEVRFEANVSVVTGIHHTADSRQPGGTHMSSVTQFQHHMAQLLETPDHSDVTFAVYAGARGTSPPTIYKAHKLILTTRSSYFRAMLSTGMVESKTGRVYIDHCRPSVFKQLLRFLYTGTCDLSGVGNEPPTAGENVSMIQALDDDESYEVTIGEGKGQASMDSTGADADACADDDDDDEYNGDDDDYDEVEEAMDADAIARRRQRKRESAARRERWGRRRQQRAVVGGRVGDAISDAALELLCAADRFDAVRTCQRDFVRLLCPVGLAFADL